MFNFGLSPTEAELALMEFERRKREEWEKKHPVQAYIERRKAKKAYEKMCKRREFLYSYNKPYRKGYFIVKVQRGDSFVSLAKKYYGNIAKHTLISKDNCNARSTEIYVGDELYFRKSEAVRNEN